MKHRNTENSKPSVTIFTDGSCVPNPGVGGWAGILKYPDHEIEIYGGFQHTSNNRMEIIAFLKCLEMLPRPHIVELYSDSNYLVKTIQFNKLPHWIKASKNGKYIKNIDLWQKLQYFTDTHVISATWVKGHSTNKYNNRCDKLAREISVNTDPQLLEIDTEYILSTT